MKLSHLFENNSFLGCYSSSLITDAIAIMTAEHLLKEKPEFVNVKLSDDHRLTSTEFDELKQLLTILKKQQGMGSSFSDTIFFDTGDEDVHDFSRFPRVIKSTIIFGDNCKFDSLKGINKHFTEIDGMIYVDGRKIKSRILGVIKIKGVKRLSMGANWRKQFIANAQKGFDFEEIIEKYLPASDSYQGGDIFDCQEELIDLGFTEYAQL